MTTAEVLIGIPGPAGLDGLVEPLARVLDAAFEERESDHYGGTYYLAEVEPDEEIRLYSNDNPADWHAFPMLLRLFHTPREVEPLLAAISSHVRPGAMLLRTT